jgi:hypothetical protein
MSCPYFDPVQPCAETPAQETARLPLGDLWEGTCRAADPAAAADPALRISCNIGYARGDCPHFPAGDGPDAVRFSVAGGSPGVVEITWVVERDHHPLQHGRLECRAQPGEAAPEDPVARQAAAYAVSYFRRLEAGAR